jgi:hypothetical protein
MRNIFIVLVLITLFQSNNSFVPASLIDNVFSKVDKVFLKTLDISGETITHDDITKFGVIQSIVQYFYNQTNGSALVNLTKSTNEYYDLTNLYQDYYGLRFCDLEVKKLIRYSLRQYVAQVDLDSDTKDMPFAHFDAETFIQSNKRVINLINQMFSYLEAKDYKKALKLSGNVLHTIQDFYSHSNWIEMGNTDINYAIGNANFTQLSIIQPNDTDTCSNNCTLVTIECGTFLKLITKLIDLAGLKFSIVSCKFKVHFKKTFDIIFNI